MIRFVNLEKGTYEVFISNFVSKSLFYVQLSSCTKRLICDPPLFNLRLALYFHPRLTFIEEIIDSELHTNVTDYTFEVGDVCCAKFKKK